MTSNLVQRLVVWSYRPYQNLEQIDHNLHRQDFDDVICKPPTCLDIIAILFMVCNDVIKKLN